MRKSRTRLGDEIVLPPLYAAWAKDLLPASIPAETEATCNDCAMLCGERRDERPAPRAPFFDPQTKCCTYVPVLPNFIVGRMLSDDGPEFARGKETLETRLASGVAVTPLGIGRSPTFELLYGASGKSLFGRSRTLRCPHYLAERGGECGVWRHRAAICATWFCKHVRGSTGLRFWQSLYTLLSTVERQLSLWCALEIGIDPALACERPNSSDVPRRLDPAEVDGEPDAETAKRLWGEWHGRGKEFFRS